ncbi:MAG: response regulator transcription factor [Oscillospiraceae bacterium]|nr:response regulator transcription factor [Oscillospiraceae bacterium]
MANNMKILVVDDEVSIVDILKLNLKRENFDVLEAYDGEMALKIALEEEPDLILLDVMLPKMDGFTVCKRIREVSQVPIIMLTAREEEIDKVLGLELGADDYITKPFSTRELMARIKSNLRRVNYELNAAVEGAADDSKKISYAGVELDLNHYLATKDGKPIDLTIREFELLKFLMAIPEKIYSRQELLERVWGYEFYGDARTVDVTVRRLREKIELDPSEPKFIATKRSLGYYFTDPSIRK